MIILPRQARDKHSEESEKRCVFSQAALLMHAVFWVTMSGSRFGVSIRKRLFCASLH
jgi:hypothetical protein